MPTAYLSTDKTIGQREDLTDILTNISPLKTPFISSIGRSTASGVYHEWQTDTLSDPAANAVGEGASAGPVTGGVTTRLGNRCQILQKVVSVTRTNVTTRKAGRTSEWEYQMEKRMKEMARDLEYACVYNSAQSSGEVTADTARYMMGLACGGYSDATSASANVVGWLSGNNYYGTAAGGLTMVASGRTNLTETLFNNLMQDIWADGGDPTLIIVGGYNKRIISAFAGNGTRYTSVSNDGAKKLSSNIRIYATDFGDVNIQESHFIGVTKLAAISPEYFALAELDPLFFEELAKTGDRRLGQYIMEVTLEARAPLSGGSIFGLASATGATAAFS